MLRRLATAVLVVLVAGACSAIPPARPATPKPATAPPVSGLAPGTYTSRAFAPAVTYTLPAGWTNPVDGPTYFQLAPAGSEIAGIHLFRDPVAASQDPQCPEAAEPNVGHTSTELTTWIRARPGLTVVGPKIVMVGGMRGVELDISIADGWKASCPFANGSPTVALFVGSKNEFRWVVAGNERLRVDLIDLPGGGLLVVDVDAFDGSVFNQLVADAAPIVTSMSFAR